VTALEACCLGIVCVYVALRVRGEAKPGLLAARLGALAVAGFLGEVSCVRLYGLYAYTSDGPWTLWLDVVPLVVVLTWPVVIHSAWELARAIAPTHAVLLGAALVLADASLIEPVAVAAKLWKWTAPGPFSVPAVGVLGWALFAALAMAVFERSEDPRYTWGGGILLPPLLVHPLVLAAWWGALRHLPPVPEAAALGVLGLACLGAAVVVWRHRVCVPRAKVWLRAPGAAFFFGLMILRVSDPLLIAWTLLFALPYAVLLLCAEQPPPLEGADNGHGSALGAQDSG
jgi:hypothetical protein